MIEEHLAILVTSDNEDLLAAGHLDSLSLVRLIAQLEARFGLELPISELGIESFRSVAGIARLLQQRLAIPEGSPYGQAGSSRDELAAEVTRLLEQKLSVRATDMDADLFESGLLDSMSLVHLILELEGYFGLELPIQQLDLAQFRSVNRIAELIDKRNAKLPF
jgi:D-alanine--poly(phosphoribitol) ligase subunit 2